MSCARELPVLEGVDLITWRADKNGCEGKRIGMRASMDHEKEKLLGLNEMQIIDLLGKPDRNELFKRNQKFYYYYFEPAGTCASPGVADPTKLTIRFNATGLAKVVLID